MSQITVTAAPPATTDEMLRAIVRRIAVFAGVALAATLLCYFAAGPTLGLVIGFLFVLAILAPAAWLSFNYWRQQAFCALLVVIGGSLILLMCAVKGQATLWEWVRMVVLLASFSLLICLSGELLLRIVRVETFAYAIVVAAAVVYLLWPIWLPQHLTEWQMRRVLPWLVDLHPGLVANGVMAAEPVWTERSFAYQLTVLDQDMPIRLPATIATCTLWNLGGSALIGALATLDFRRFGRRVLAARRRPAATA